MKSFPKPTTRAAGATRIRNLPRLREAPAGPLPERRARRDRRGAATVEFALVVPLFLLLLFGMIEFGRMVMIQQVIVNASREGARQAVVEGSTTEQVKDIVETYMSASHVPVNREDIELSLDPAESNPGQPIMVQIRVPYEEVSWLPSSLFLGGKRLTASSVMRKEGIQ